jgi:hypothetical protein
MTLDMLKLGAGVSQMGRSLLERGVRYPDWVAHARRQLRALAPDWEGLAEVARGATNRLATPRERMDLRYGMQEVPHAYRAIATDGSQIEPDRHGIADYYVLNVGWAVIEYGHAPAADLASEPSLYHEPEDLYIVHGDRRVPVQDRHLSARRACAEMEKAAALARAHGADGTPTVVLADGTLQLWVLEERPENFLREALLAPYVAAMQEVGAANVPLAGYMSRPRHAEVTGLLREATCKRGIDPCPACAGRAHEPCVFDRLPDRALFENLEEGERSALFEVTFREDLAVYYEGQVPHFFYMNVGSELARVEVPAWTAANPDWLLLIQSVVYDQCRKGLGYPNVLARAHEQALVSSADRKAFGYFLDGALARLGVPARTSEKQLSKRLRAV